MNDTPFPKPHPNPIPAPAHKGVVLRVLPRRGGLVVAPDDGFPVDKDDRLVLLLDNEEDAAPPPPPGDTGRGWGRGRPHGNAATFAAAEAAGKQQQQQQQQQRAHLVPHDPDERRFGSGPPGPARVAVVGWRPDGQAMAQVLRALAGLLAPGSALVVLGAAPEEERAAALAGEGMALDGAPLVPLGAGPAAAAAQGATGTRGRRAAAGGRAGAGGRRRARAGRARSAGWRWNTPTGVPPPRPP